MKPPGDRDRAGNVLSGAEFAGLGLQFALTLLLFAFLGIWLDDRLHTTPWLLLVFVFAGAAGAFYSMYRRVAAAQRRDAERRAARRADLNAAAQREDRGPTEGSR